jgi:ferrous iron transport protein A
MTLNEAPLDIELRIASLCGEPSIRKRLAEFGFFPGETVRGLRRALGNDGPLAVRVGSSTYALRAAEALCVEVEMASV